jgi:hypothetical protein
MPQRWSCLHWELAGWCWTWDNCSCKTYSRSTWCKHIMSISRHIKSVCFVVVLSNDSLIIYTNALGQVHQLYLLILQLCFNKINAALNLLFCVELFSLNNAICLVTFNGGFFPFQESKHSSYAVWSTSSLRYEKNIFPHRKLYFSTQVIHKNTQLILFFHTSTKQYKTRTTCATKF